MKSIKMKILATILPFVIVVITLVIGLLLYGMYESTVSALEESMNSSATIASLAVQNQLEAHKDLSLQFSYDRILTQEIPNQNAENYDDVKNEVLEYCEELRSTHDLAFLQVMDKNGVELGTGMDFAYEPYFHHVRDVGTPYITDYITSLITGDLLIMVAAPIERNGEFDGCVLYAVSPSSFSEIVSQIVVGEGGIAEMVDSSGTVIASPDTESVTNKYNVIEDAKNNPDLEGFSMVIQNLIDDQSDFARYSQNGTNKFAAYTPVSNTNGWGLYITADEDVFLEQMNTFMYINVIVAFIAIIILTTVIFRVANNISKPVQLCADRLSKLADGDLKTAVPDIKTNDETKVLANSTSIIVNNLSVIIDDIGMGLGEMSKGNFDIQINSEEYFKGDFHPLAMAMNNLIGKMTETIAQINVSTEQVQSGNEQMSMGSQSLARGATEQAEAVQGLATMIASAAEQIKQTTADSQEAKTITDKAMETLAISDEQMNKMMDAMLVIDAKSNEISKIIKTIDDIAFQTNILSLNAAVEAARAGSAGKGFAVVADEVRNLATKSAQSAKETATLIEETVAAVKEGAKISEETKKALDMVEVVVEQITEIVEKIAVSTAERMRGISRMNVEIDQISSVVHTNSATAEESAEASEKLSSQANMLKEIVGQFTLNGTSMEREKARS